MKHLYSFKTALSFCSIILCSLFLLPGNTSAQTPTLKMSDFVLFSGNGITGSNTPASPGYGVFIGSSTTITGGSVASFNIVKTTGGATFGNTTLPANITNIYSKGRVVLNSSNIVTGKITASNSPVVSGTILSVGSSANLTGNVDVNGNIVILGGTVTGKVTTNTSYTGPTPAGGKVIGSPTLPVFPSIPAITGFQPYPIPMKPDITSGKITPGAYDDIKLPGGATLTFDGPGIYVFDKIQNNGSNSFVFDFTKNISGTFKIYIHNYALLDKISVSLIGGSATKIYTEVHGTGSDDENEKYAFQIGNGTSAGNKTKWFGTVWAPYGAINIGGGGGNCDVTGAIWSGTQVNIGSSLNIIYAPFSECVTPNVNAGPDKPLDFGKPTTLTGTSSTTGATFSWSAINGGVITSPSNVATITVSSAGTYILTATSGTNCTANDTVIVTSKLNNLIGSELSSVVQNFVPNGPPSPFFTIQGDSILIDIITKVGQYGTALAKYKAAPYGLANTDVFTNGSSNFIITGLFQIGKLPLLNLDTSIIVYVRPHYSGFTNSGLVSSAGDTAMKSNLVRNGYQVGGAGVKVGVISNSFSTITAGTTTPFKTNTAAQDVQAGDLPGIGNPDGDLLPVHVLKDYPFKSSDEGRGMLQIVHDVAPKAELYFRTGFLSAGDFAAGIQELKDAGCNIIVDDVTYPTEPFLKDGVVAAAVDAVSAAGVTYFSSAGNFANNSYENTFSRITGGNAHNFGGGDSLQSVTLQPGNYTIVLQWEDNIYSLGQTAGTKNDLDIFLTPDGKSLFGFNRDNTNGDPIEILPFTITSAVNTNILIRNNTIGSNPARFKYIVFQGNITINEYNTGTSTVIGQANALGAIAVAAARFNKTDSIESFSSIGGTFVNGIQRQKPDITAPEGVNTTVNLGPDYPSTALDGYSNFFGTSAAAPHAAGVAALIMEGRDKYLRDPILNTPIVTSPAQIKTILQTSATDMYPTITPGFDLKSGAGFINADSAMRTFAKPFPTLVTLVVPPAVTPGQAPFTLTLTGLNLSPTSVIKFRDSTLGTTIINSSTASAGVPAFTGNPIISVYTPPVSPSGKDGGSSDSLKFFDIVKKNITIKADNKTKKYAQIVPALTATILVDGDSLQHTSLSLADLGLTNLSVATLATPDSSVGTYTITPARVFDPANPADVGFKELYNYTFVQGSLSIEKLPVTVTANNVTVTYGQKIPDIQFTYQFDGTNIPDSTAFSNGLQSAHQSQLAKDGMGNDILGLVNGKAVTIVNGKAIPIVNGDEAAIVNGKAVTIVNGKAIPIVNGKAITIVNGKAIPIVNNLTADDTQSLSFLATAPALQNAREIVNKTNGSVTGSTKVVDITQESILDFNENSAQTYMLSSVSDVSPRGLVDMESIVNGKAITIVNGDDSIGIVNGKAVTIVNGKAVTIVNGQELTIVNGKAVTIVNGKAVTIVNGQAVPIVNGESKTAVILDSSEIGQGESQLKSLNMITGLDVGNQFIIPGSLLNDNLDITHKVGVITVIPAPLTITPTAGLTKVYGKDDSVFTYTNSGGLVAEDFTGALSRVDGKNVGTYAYTIGTLSAGNNYTITLDGANTFAITAKPITITPDANQSKVFGVADPIFTYTASEVLLSGDAYTGALGRIAGETVATGPYAFTLGTLSAGSNYILTLGGVNTFAITTKQVIVTPLAGQSKAYGSADPVFTFTNDGGLTAVAFTGAPGRISGDDVGTYAYTLGNLSAGTNYSLVLSAIVPLPTFAIIIKSVVITPTAGQTKVYGSNDPAFTFTNDAGLASANFTGAISRVSGNDVGSYAFTMGILSAGTNYSLSLAAVNTFSITKAPLQVKADDKFIFKGDALPVFTSTITGLKYTDNPTVTYSLSPTCVGAAGVYSIIPSLVSTNYTVTVTNGKLYINPKGYGVDDVDVYLECVEDRGASYMPANRRYVARFYSKNTNAVSVYIPIGSNNILSSANGPNAFDGSRQVTVFLPGYGTTKFLVPFDGSTLTWTVKTYEGNSIATESASASYKSNKCSTVTLSVRAASSNVTLSDVQDQLKQIAQDEVKPAGNVNVYPNPARGRTTIYLSNDVISVKGLLLYDAYGKPQAVKGARQISKNAIEIDMTGFVSGMYFIKVKGENGYKNISIVKE